MATATTDTGTGGRFRALGTLTGAVGVAFSASWITSMLVGAPMLDVDATGTAIVDTVTGREGALFAQYLFSEGLPAIGIAVISFALARAAATARTATALRALGLAAALLSLVQFTCGAWLSASAVPNGDTGLAGTLLEVSNRGDGAKMFLLAALALTALPVLTRRLRWTGLALAVSIAVSGLGYLLLVPALAPVAYVSGPLLLVWMTGSALAVARAARPAA
ncbi:hypothetical protein [Spirillospora sp. NBC_01491]|uniref:hypothetical protein n=1 Tax=Spirillospora sp. NBC_01491 TaxID=2976007 RepID=UPI002E3641F2|nr:hypothetical protein [Spirillospora sp. NBC_01491]